VEPLDGFAGPGGTGPAALDDARKIALLRRGGHADWLAQPPLRRAVRSALEAAHCAVELRELLGDARTLAPRGRDLRSILAAAELTAADLAAEVDDLGLALGQLELVGGSGP
jgi:hypothetical protein